MTNTNKSKVRNWPVIFKFQTSENLKFTLSSTLQGNYEDYNKTTPLSFLEQLRKITKASSEGNRQSAGDSVPSVNNSLYITATPVRWIFFLFPGTCSKKGNDLSFF